MSIKELGKNLIIVLSAIVLVACGTTSTDNDSATEAVSEPVVETVVETPTESAEDRLARINAETRAARVIYFDFDDSTVKAQYQDLIKAHAWYLSRNAGTQIVVEGHCDERGTPEYNLALGERRGNSIKDILISYGVSSSQIRVVSYGEEKPENPNHNEMAWEKNRRAVLSYEG